MPWGLPTPAHVLLACHLVFARASAALHDVLVKLVAILGPILNHWGCTCGPVASQSCVLLPCFMLL